MGIYLFNTDVLIPVLLKDAEDPNSSHDFGKDILPKMVDEYQVYAFNFVDENKKEALYWRDVGTLEAYYEANMDLVSVSPVFNLYDEIGRSVPTSGSIRRRSLYSTSLDAPDRRLIPSFAMGCIVSGSLVKNCVLSPDVRVNSYSRNRFQHPFLARQRRTPLPHSQCHYRSRCAYSRGYHHWLRPRSRPPAIFRYREWNHGGDARLLAV